MKKMVLQRLLFALLLLASCGAPYAFAGNGLLNTSSDNNSGYTTGGSDCEKMDQCFSFGYKGYVVSRDGKTVTLTFKVKTDCKRDLSCVAFELPFGSTAYAVGNTKYRYKTYLTTQPFPSLKFESRSYGCKDGDSDVFSYVMAKTAFDKLTTLRVQAKAGQTTGTVAFDKDCHLPKCVVSATAISNVKYIVGDSTYTPTPATYTAVMQKIVKEGKAVTVCFTVPASAGYNTYSLVSYKAPYPTFVRAKAHLQEVFDFKTVTVGPAGGNVRFTVKVPACFYQVDFVKGCIIEKLGPSDTAPTNFYSMQNRLYASAEGGSKGCTEEEKLGQEGCTPGYWKQDQHFGNWAPLVPTGAGATKFFDVFDVCDQTGNACKYRGLPANLTLLQALQLNGGGFCALARHAAAAYLNAVNTEVDYSYKESDIVAKVIEAFKTGNSYYIHYKLEAANEKHCPLKRSTWHTGSTVLASGENNITEQTAAPESRLTVFPTPFRTRATVAFTLRQAGQYRLNLYDLQGRLMQQLKTGRADAGKSVQAFVENRSLVEGVYVVKLITATETQTVKLVYQK